MNSAAARRAVIETTPANTRGSRRRRWLKAMAIDPRRRISGEVLRAGQIRGQGVEVVADHLGAGVLTGGEPSEAGSVFEFEAMLDAFERLLDPPALVIEIGEGCRRIAFGVEQGRHEYAHLARGVTWRIRRTEDAWRGHS